MGRGVAYPYEEFVLIDEVFELEAENGIEPTEDDYQFAVDWQMDEIKAVLRARGGEELDNDDRRRALQGDWLGCVNHPNRFLREAHLLFEFDRFMVGIEPADSHTCLFVVPLVYYRQSRSGHDYVTPYNISRDAIRLFNAIHRSLPGRLKVATSAWTTAPYRTERA